MDTSATSSPGRTRKSLTPLTVAALLFLGLLLVFAIGLTLASLLGARVPFLCSI